MSDDWRGFPNLQLIGERFYVAIKSIIDKTVHENFLTIKETMENDPEYYKTNPKPPTEAQFEILGVFQQFWPNTAGLFENGGFSGQELTTYYTTVLRDNLTGYHAVFQGNSLVYAITNSFEDGEFDADAFYKDVDNHSIKPLKEIGVYWKVNAVEDGVLAESSSE